MGAFISTHQSFPEGCNAGFAERIGPGEIRLRVVERGAGETLACGSGACAAVAILRRSGRVRETVDVRLPGGRLVIRWRGNDEPMIMKGPAEHVFRGTMNE
jgi:diaminopimelate epimerase